MDIERRYLPGGDVQVLDDGGPRSIIGYAAKFDIRSADLGGFQEVIRPGAFSRTLREPILPVVALFNHNENYLLGSTANGTLTLSEDSRGLFYNITPPDTSYSRDLMACIKRGDLGGSSFAFKIRKQERKMDGNQVIRELVDVDLLDVSPVVRPAYPDTSVAVRFLQLNQATPHRDQLERWLANEGLAGLDFV